MTPPRFGPADDLMDGALEWLASLEKASAANDARAFGDAFLPGGWMRDMLCFAWDFAAVGPGPDNILEFISRAPHDASLNPKLHSTRFEHAGLHSFTIDRKSTLPSPRPSQAPEGMRGVEGAFSFCVGNPRGFGRGYFRLVQINPGAKWKAFSVLFSLWDLEGHVERFERVNGHLDDPVMGKRRLWDDLKEERRRVVEEDPVAVIVGGGQAGLMTAARLQHMGIRALVIEKTPRVGDVWRNRYNNLTLHTSTHVNTFLYESFPRTAPKYLPKNMVADYMEAYVTSQELTVWTSATVLPHPTYDDVSGRWTIRVVRGFADGRAKTVNLHPRHVIMATGSGEAYLPDVKGLKEGVFKGLSYHSNNHHDGKVLRGKTVLIVGAGNAAADMTQDAYSNGAAQVTMIQRSGTCVITEKSNEAMAHVDYVEDEGVPRYNVDDADLAHNSMPLPLLMEISAQPETGITAGYKRIDREILDGLAKAGFKLNWSLVPGGPEYGFVGILFQKAASGTLLDVGCVQLILDGKVKVKSGSGVSEMAEDGVILEDRTRLSADVVIFATGNKSILESLAGFFPPSVRLPNRVGGMADDGDLAAAFRPTPQQGLWFTPGGFSVTRFLSKHLALQILAQEVGLKRSGAVISTYSERTKL